MMLKEEDLPQTDGIWERFGASWRSKLNEQLHNSLGPAIIYDGGETGWLVNGKLDRLDGPAVEQSDGSKAWYVDGKYVLEQDFPSAVISLLLDVDKFIEQEMKL